MPKFVSQIAMYAVRREQASTYASFRVTLNNVQGSIRDHDGPFGCAANVARAAASATRSAILAGAALPFTATVT